jgi:hypothetical protein
MRDDAIYCNSCGASVNRNNMNNTSPGNGSNYYISLREKSAGIAIVLGFLYAGLGHLYAGKLTRGLCILFGNMALSIPMIVLTFWWLFFFLMTTIMTTTISTVIFQDYSY